MLYLLDVISYLIYFVFYYIFQVRYVNFGIQSTDVNQVFENKIAKILKSLAHKNTETVSWKICIQPERYTSQPFCMLTTKEDLANREKTLCDSQRDFAEKKSGLNDAFKAFLLYKVNPSYSLFRHLAQCVNSRAIEIWNELHMLIYFFPFSTHRMKKYKN